MGVSGAPADDALPLEELGEASKRVELVGDSAAPPNSRWVKFLPGKFTMGQPGGGEFIPASLNATNVEVDGFAISKFEVSVAQYDACVAAGECAERRVSDECLVDPSMPANCLSFQAASDVCRWQGGRLPTETEWEFAARGPEGRSYPWGEKWRDADDVAIGKRHPVESAPREDRDTPEGIQDMGGNVREWTSTPSGEGSHVTKSMMCTDLACLTYNRFPGESDASAMEYVGARCVRPFGDVEGPAAEVGRFVDRRGPRSLHWAMLETVVKSPELPAPLSNHPSTQCWVETTIDPQGRATTPDTTYSDEILEACPEVLRPFAVEAVRKTRFKPSPNGIVTILPVRLGSAKP